MASPLMIWAALAAATAVGFALRAAYVADQSLGYEEVFTASVVGHPTAAGVWNAVDATESTPPLYYLLTWCWVHLTGSHTETALRTTSLLAGVATIPAAFLAARRLVTPRLALVVAWLSAVSPLLVVYSVYARSYALLVLISTLSVWALGAVLERPTPRRWLLWALAAAGCLWTHYFTVFLLIGEAAVLWVRLPHARIRLVGALALAAAAAAPLEALFRSQNAHTGRTAFIAAQPLAGRLEAIPRQFAMGLNVPHAWLEGAGILLVGAAAALAAARLRRSAGAQALAATALIAAGLPILTAVTGVDDHLLPRNIAAVWICLAPLAAYGLTRLRGLPLLAYTAICLAAVATVLGDWRYQGSTDWRGASGRIRAEAGGVPVAVIPAVELDVAGHYMHRSPLAAPVHTADLWVMVEPVRAAGQRALHPVAGPRVTGLWDPTLRPVAEVDYRGFRLIHLRAPAPVVVVPMSAAGGASPTAQVLAP